MNDWEAKTLDVQFKNFVPKALVETLKHQHNTCIGRRTYMKLANAIGKEILGLNKLENYSISQEDILNHFIESKDDDCENIIAIPSAYPYSNITEALAQAQGGDYRALCDSGTSAEELQGSRCASGC